MGGSSLVKMYRSALASSPFIIRLPNCPSGVSRLRLLLPG